MLIKSLIFLIIKTQRSNVVIRIIFKVNVITMPVTITMYVATITIFYSIVSQKNNKILNFFSINVFKILHRA